MKQPPKDRSHLRVVGSGATSAAAPLSACARAQARLCLAVATHQSDQYDAQLQVLHSRGISREQLSELMTLTVEMAGPEVMITAAEVMDRYDIMCQPG